MATYYQIYYNCDHKLHKFGYYCDDGHNILEEIIIHIKNNHNIINRVKAISMIESITVVTCIGCQYDKCGQIEHMGPGGCLDSDWTRKLMTDVKR